MSEFCNLDAPLEPEDPPPHCAKCRENGPPRRSVFNISRRQLQAVRIVFAGVTPAQGVKAAVLATGYSANHIRDMIAGRRVPEVRRCYQMMLEAAGADAEKVIRVLVEAMDANDAKYHPGKGEFVEHADHRTRLRAAQHVSKTLELDPPRKEGVNVGVAITFNTNLGDGETYDPPNIMRAEPIVDVSDA